MYLRAADSLATTDDPRSLVVVEWFPGKGPGPSYQCSPTRSTAATRGAILLNPEPHRGFSWRRAPLAKKARIVHDFSCPAMPGERLASWQRKGDSTHGSTSFCNLVGGGDSSLAGGVAAGRRRRASNSSRARPWVSSWSVTSATATRRSGNCCSKCRPLSQPAEHGEGHVWRFQGTGRGSQCDPDCAAAG